jgi:hypothetical protein
LITAQVIGLKKKNKCQPNHKETARHRLAPSASIENDMIFFMKVQDCVKKNLELVENKFNPFVCVFKYLLVPFLPN